MRTPSRFDPLRAHFELKRRVDRIEKLPRGGGGGGNMEAFWWGNSAPLATGQNGGIWTVPFVSGASVSFTMTRAYFRMEGASTSGSYQIKIQKSPAGATFVPTDLTTLTLAAGVNETSAVVAGTLTSGQLLRIFWVTLGSNGSIFTIQLEAHQ